MDHDAIKPMTTTSSTVPAIIPAQNSKNGRYGISKTYRQSSQVPAWDMTRAISQILHQGLAKRSSGKLKILDRESLKRLATEI